MKILLPLVSCLFLATPALPALAEAPPPPTQSISPSADEALSADSPRTTVDGHRFVAPAGWSIKTIGPTVVLTAPEKDSHIALVDVREAKDADAAVAAAWAAHEPDATRSVKRAGDRLVRNGWEQVRGYQYERRAGDKRAVGAVARRHRNRWSVALYDLDPAVAEKRDAQLALILDVLPAGHVPESFAGKNARTLDATRIAALNEFVEHARRQFDVPGVAIGIVQGGKVVLAEGFGVRELGKPDKVDADTLFMIASNTKALTTLMLAKQVEAGRFDWDTPVTQVLPSFKLGDADTTRQVQMRHLVCACTGLPRQDMEGLFESERFTPATLMATLATMQPTTGFGELYQYSNPLASAAGFIGGHASHPQMELGAAYDAAMQTLVFDPLGMTSTTFDFARAQRGNHAAAHGEDVDGNVVPSSMDLNYADIAQRPNGGAWSNVRDMLRYVRMELDRGRRPDGTRYIAEAPLLERRVQQVATGKDQGYGMGLKLDRTSGTMLVQHGGIAFGYISNMMWLPEHNVGAVILTNANSGGIALRNLFRRRWLEVLFDANPEALSNVSIEAKGLKETYAAHRKPLAVPAESAAVGALASRYRSAELGDIAVTQEGESTWFDFGGWKSEVASRRGDDHTLLFVTITPGKEGFEFVVADNGKRRSLVLSDAQHEYVFAEAQ